MFKLPTFPDTNAHFKTPLEVHIIPFMQEGNLLHFKKCYIITVSL
jgi:hypothetical protein